MSLIPTKDLYQHRGHALVTAPAAEPVTADEFRAHIRDVDMTDTEAEGWIESARVMIEDKIGVAMISQTWRLALDSWPCGRKDVWWGGWRQGAIGELNGEPVPVVIPRAPLVTVDTVTVYDDSDGSTAVDVATTFYVDTYANPARLVLRPTATWPYANRDANAIEIVYTAGYGASGASVPAPLRLAVLNVAAYLYSHRGDECTAADAMSAASAQLSNYKRARI